MQFIEGGFSQEESRETCQKLEDAGISIIELSGGTYESMSFSHKSESTRVRFPFHKKTRSKATADIS